MAGRGGKSPLCRHSIRENVLYMNTMLVYILNYNKIVVVYNNWLFEMGLSPRPNDSDIIH